MDFQHSHVLGREAVSLATVDFCEMEKPAQDTTKSTEQIHPYRLLTLMWVLGTKLDSFEKQQVLLNH